MSRVFEVSRSGYYCWLKRRKSRRKCEDDELLKEIREIYRASRKTYGSPRIYEKLKAAGYRISEKRVARLMKLHGITPRIRKKRKIRTTDSNHKYPVSPDLLKRNFRVASANRVWVSDISYIWTFQGWLYLCLVMDLFSRKIVGWSLKTHLRTSIAKEALRMARERRRPSVGLIFHSDRGVQYASHEFRDELRKYGMFSSMSRKGDCWDNACAESVFGTIKNELVNNKHYITIDQAKLDIFEYIEVFYNRQRIHSYLDYLSPEEFEKRNVA